MKGLSPRYVEGIVKGAMKGTLSTGQAAARPVRLGKTIAKAAENARDGRHEKKTGLSTDLDFG
jgi:hypothetical protein